MQTPWINYKVMKEISSEQKYNCQIEPIEMDQASQQNSPYSDFTNEFLDVEKESEASHCELLTPSETNVGDVMDTPLDIDDVEETKPVEEQNDVSPLDFNCEKLIPFETNVGDEMNDPLDSEDTDETKPMEEQNFVACLASIISPETNVEDKMNDPINIEDTEETKPMEEQNFASPSEMNVGDEMNGSLDSDDAEETKPVEEQDFTTQLDSKRETCSPSESDVGKKIICLIDSEEMENNNFTDRVHAIPGSVQEVYCKTKKSPFSTHVEIDDFLHAPICGEVVKNTFDFLDPNNHLTPQFETKLFSTTADYPEQPDCRLVHSKINQITFLMKTDTYDKNNQKSNPSKSVVVPLHNTQSTKKGETEYLSYTGDFMHIRAPVVVGEYKIEICLEEKIVFEKGIEGVKDISNEVVLTNCRFVPNQFSQSLGNGTCSTLRGNLFIEGYIHQSIEYTASHIGNAVSAQNESLIHSNQMCQNIVLEIIIHLLQAQKIRVPKI